MFRIALAVLFLGAPLWARSQPTKQAHLNGSVETGLVLGGPPRDSQWLVDQLEWNQRFDASERVHFVFNNAVSLYGPTGLSGFNNSVSYFSNLRLPGTNFTLASAGAYMEIRASDALSLSVGHFRIPFGQEATGSRYDSLMYYYSGAFSTAQTGRWLWNLGVQAEISRVIPGQLTLSVLDGRLSGGESSPALAAHYELTLDRGGFSLIPSFSGYLGRLQGGFNDAGLTAGFLLLAGRFSLTAEYLWVKQNGVPYSLPLVQTTSIFAEPSFDLGVVEVGAKAEMQTLAGQNDLHLSFGLTKTFSDRLRLRVLYQAAGIQGRIRAGQQDIRILLGTHW